MSVHILIRVCQVLIIAYCIIQVNAAPTPKKDEKVPPQPAKPGSKDLQGNPLVEDGIQKSNDPTSKTDKGNPQPSQKDASKMTSPDPVTDNGKSKQQSNKSTLKKGQQSGKKKVSSKSQDQTEGQPEVKDNPQGSENLEEYSKNTDPVTGSKKRVLKRTNAGGKQPKGILKKKKEQSSSQDKSEGQSGDKINQQESPVEDKTPQTEPSSSEEAFEQLQPQNPNSAPKQPKRVKRLKFKDEVGQPLENVQELSAEQDENQDNIQDIPVEDPQTMPQVEDPGSQDDFVHRIIPDSGLHRLTPHQDWAYQNPESLGQNLNPVPDYESHEESPNPADFYHPPGVEDLPPDTGRGSPYGAFPGTQTPYYGFSQSKYELERALEYLEYLKMLHDSQEYSGVLYI